MITEIKTPKNTKIYENTNPNINKFKIITGVEDLKTEQALEILANKNFEDVIEGNRFKKQEYRLAVLKLLIDLEDYITKNNKFPQWPKETIDLLLRTINNKIIPISQMTKDHIESL